MKHTVQHPARNRLPVRPWISVRFTPLVVTRPVDARGSALLEAHSIGMRDARVRSGTLSAPRPAGRPTACAAVRFPPV